MCDHDWQGLLVCYEGNYILNQINHITMGKYQTDQDSQNKTSGCSNQAKPNHV